MRTEQRFSILFGVVFILIGTAGFIPAFLVNDHLLFGLFEINTMHNGVHLLTGIVALLAALKEYTSRLFFQVFGILYGLVTIAGFVYGHVLMMHMNTADNILHLIITIAALYIGFVVSKKTV